MARIITNKTNKVDIISYSWYSVLFVLFVFIIFLYSADHHPFPILGNPAVGGYGPVFQHSNSLRVMPDCLIIDWSVPIRTSGWLGTGTVIVVSGSFFCMAMWLPRCRTLTNPCLARITQTSLPERIRNLAKGDLHLCYIHFVMETLFSFSG